MWIRDGTARAETSVAMIAINFAADSNANIEGAGFG